ncbi:MAG: VanW family protein [Candidatus Scatovivens sp.]
MNLRKNKLIYIYIIILAIFIGISIASLIVFYYIHLKNNTIQSGIYIKGVNVSGLTKDEAKANVDNYLNEVMNDHIILEYKNNEYFVGIEQINANFNVDSAVEYAYNIGRSKNIFKDVKQIFSVLFTKINIDPVLEYNQVELEKYIENIQANLPDQLEQSSYYTEDNKLIITSGKNGAGIYKERLKNDILEALQTISYNNQIIEIPTYVEYPEKIDLQKIHNEIYRETKNAYYTKEPYAVYTHVVGVDFNVEEAQALINSEEKEEYIIKLNMTVPEVTINDIGLDAFPNLISEFSTNYVASNKNRSTNLKLASDKINGVVIMPGETFSFNKTVGKRTEEAGYKEAAIYADGQVTNDIGGGICQIVSTLYNAVVQSNLDIISRRNHMFTTSYVPAGKDATVAWGSTDFKFKNSRNYPIKIVSSVSGGVAKVSVYGLLGEDEYDIKIETEYIRTINYSTKYISDSGYKSGTIIQSGSNGCIVDSYKVYRKNGTVIKKEKISRDTYTPQDRKIAR